MRQGQWDAQGYIWLSSHQISSFNTFSVSLHPRCPHGIPDIVFLPVPALAPRRCWAHTAAQQPPSILPVPGFPSTHRRGLNRAMPREHLGQKSWIQPQQGKNRLCRPAECSAQDEQHDLIQFLLLARIHLLPPLQYRLSPQLILGCSETKHQRGISWGQPKSLVLPACSRPPGAAVLFRLLEVQIISINGEKDQVVVAGDLPIPPWRSRCWFFGGHPSWGRSSFLRVLLCCSAFLCYLLPEDEVGNWLTGTPAPSPFLTHGFLALRG